ncbi:hypothetical protein PSAB6_110046 [Paraburkholderia sabiae]|nr:hypothetical protein PSAB6_110046 [Paraburkholderia sabiae]
MQVIGDAYYVVHMRRDLIARYAIDVQRDSRRAAAIAEPVNAVAPGARERHRARFARMLTHGHRAIAVRLPVVQGFRQRAVDHRIAAPRVMRVNRTRLARHPHERSDRIAAVRVGGEQMASVAGGGRFALIVREKRGIGGGFGKRSADRAGERRMQRRIVRLGAGIEGGVEGRAESRDSSRFGRRTEERMRFGQRRFACIEAG